MEVGVRTGHPYTLGAMFDRTRIPAEGYAGGERGGYGRITVGDGPGSRELRDKSQVTVGADDRVTFQLPGGGGFFDPFTRDPAAVLDDVLDGFVSAEAARELYGVAIDVASKRVDEAATAELRRSRREG
jgi:N-methylhydantoinase B